MSFTGLTSTQLVPTEQGFAKNCRTKFYENPANSFSS